MHLEAGLQQDTARLFLEGKQISWEIFDGTQAQACLREILKAETMNHKRNKRNKYPKAF